MTVSFYFLGRSELKDFSTLSLPPKPKPPDTKQFISKYLFNIEDFTIKSMKSEEVLANRENSVIPSETAALEATSPSSDSGLSGSICLQLFGDDCPQTRKSSHRIQEASPSLGERQSKQSLKSSSGELGEDKALLSVKEGSQNKQIAPEEVLLSSVGVGEEKPLLSSRTSTQLNQLLYKDDRTEISLVQQLNPEKVSPRKPSVKLQINLHNSIVPDLEMKSPRSQDKMVETRESFPLHPDWAVASSKMMGNTDKIQQTSENDIYKRLGADKSEQSPDVPEKDCKTNCQCSICLISRLHQPCGCYRCKPPRPPDLDPPDFLLPPPPPPPLRRYCCDCCLYHPPLNHYNYSPQQEFYPHRMYQEPFSSDLPYQNNDDYLDLVQELEETLHSRNRNRVKRAMHEFESRSKQNKPLEKPIIDYDETGDSEEVIRKIDRLRGDKINVKSKGFKSGRGQGSRWRMDPDSGEWQKNDSTQTKPTPDRGGKSREGRAGDCCHCSCNCQRNYE